MAVIRLVTRLCFFVLLSLPPVLAQTELVDSASIREFFPNVKDSLVIAKNGFYLANVTDMRSNKANNGYLERASVKKKLVFQDSLTAYIASFVKPTKKAPLLVPLNLQIEKLKLFSSTDGKTDIGQIYVKLNFFDGISNERIKTFERTINYRKKAEVDFVGNVVYEAFRVAFIGLRPKTILKTVPALTSADSAELTEEVIVKLENEEQKRPVHVIPISSLAYEWESSTFYLAGLKDIRYSQQNVGMVKKGYFSQKYEAHLEGGLKEYLKKVVTSSPDSFKKGLTLYVNSFQLSEEATSDGEECHLLFSAFLAYDSLGSIMKVYQNSVSIDTSFDGDFTSQWPALIQKSIEHYLVKFNQSLPTAIIVASEELGQNSYFSSHEIREERYGYKDRFFYRNNELNGLRDFNTAFKTDADSIRNTFASGKTLLYLGRISIGFGGALWAYSAVDFLLSEEKSLKDWYNRGKESSTIMKFIDKKAVIQTGAVHMIGGLICNVIGKMVLDKAIRMHNKSLADRISWQFIPNFPDKGMGFQFNLFLGLN